jgi:2-C-methyl-D-erythritol 2,4-cyclodiphosphate synthase
MGFASEMRNVIADILDITVDDISVKATTTEKLGFIGKEEGIMAQAVVLLRKPD